MQAPSRRMIGLLYATAIAANGVLLWMSVRDRPQVQAFIARIRGCTGCARRREALRQMMAEATRIVRHEPEPEETARDDG